MDFNHFLSLLQRGSGTPGWLARTGARWGGTTSSRAADMGRRGPRSSRVVDAALLGPTTSRNGAAMRP
jgi:hypothetical protein